MNIECILLNRPFPQAPWKFVVFLREHLTTREVCFEQRLRPVHPKAPGALYEKVLAEHCQYIQNGRLTFRNPV